MRSRVCAAAIRAAEAIGSAWRASRETARVLHVSDLHNRPGAYRLMVALAEVLRPDLAVCTGDLSGIGGPLEMALLRSLGRALRPARLGCPVVFAPGNHDSALTEREMRRLGAEVLSDPRAVTAGGIRVWGYRDPNRSVLNGAPYDPSLTGAVAAEVALPEDGPCVVAVHSEAMVRTLPAGARLVLCGHIHTPAVRTVGGALFVRPGAAGGDHLWSGPLRAGVVDLDLPRLVPLRVWLLQIVSGDWGVQEFGPDGRPGLRWGGGEEGPSPGPVMVVGSGVPRRER